LKDKDLKRGGGEDNVGQGTNEIALKTRGKKVRPTSSQRNGGEMAWGQRGPAVSNERRKSTGRFNRIGKNPHSTRANGSVKLNEGKKKVKRTLTAKVRNRILGV